MHHFPIALLLCCASLVGGAGARPCPDGSCLPRPGPSPSPGAASPVPAQPPSPAPQQPTQQERFTGTATVWGGHQGVGIPLGAEGAASLACGLPQALSFAQARFAAVNLAAHPAACARCLLVVCGAAGTCPNRGIAAAQPLYIVDDCGDCGPADLLIDAATLEEMTGYGSSGRPLPSSGRVAVEWSWVPCAPLLLKETIRMSIMPGGNAFYKQLAFGSAWQPITAASINGQPLVAPTASQPRWQWYAGGRPLNATAPLLVSLTAAGGSEQHARLPALQEQQDLGVQFF
ncbi:hypothetical protein ABPG75_000368 [Micractinium tetrahymenae]